MGNMFINGVPYGGAQYRELTQAEYDALTTEEKNNGTIYFITDGAGGSGTDVEANPQGTATDDLEKIRIGNTIYDIPHVDDSHSETILYDDSVNNENITLNDSILNYDQIYLICRSTENSNEYRIDRCWPVSYIREHINDNTWFSINSDSWYCNYSFPTASSIHRENYSSLYLVRVIGVRYDGGVELSGSTKNAILNCIANVAWANSRGNAYYNALEQLFHPDPHLLSITALFTPGSSVFYENGDIEELRSYLIVTGYYDSGITEPIRNYVLTGNLISPSSTITVTYSGRTTTFTVSVEALIDYEYNWDFTESLTDLVAGKTAVLSAATGHTAPQRTSAGVLFTEATQRIYFGSDFVIRGHTIEYDVASASFSGDTSYHIRQLVMSNSNSSSGYGLSPFLWRSGTGWSMCGYKAETGTGRTWVDVWNGLSGSSSEVLNCMSGKTVKMVISSDGDTTKLYIGGTLIGSQSGVNWRANTTNGYLSFGSGPSYDQSSGDQCYNLTLTGLRIYETIE